MRKMNLVATICFLLICVSISAQEIMLVNSRTSCNYFEETKADTGKVIVLSEGEERAKKIIDKILEPVGLFSNFEIREGNVANALASFKNEKRYIIYNKKFINRVEKQSSGDYSLTAILAHEVAHHLLGHTFEINEKRPEVEIEADFWSGFILYKLGSTLNEAQEVIKKEAPPFPVGSYPGKEARLLAIKEGWEKAKSQVDSERRNEDIRRKRYFNDVDPENEKLIALHQDSSYIIKADTDSDILNPPLTTSGYVNDENAGSPKTLEGWKAFIDEISKDNRLNNGKVNINNYNNNYGYIGSGGSSVVVTIGNEVYVNTNGTLDNDTIPIYSKPILSEIKLPPISGISSSLPVSIELSQGMQSITILAPVEITNLINRNVNNGTWHLSIQKSGAYDFSGVKIHISLPYIDHIQVVGSGDVNAKMQFIQEQPVNIDISGSGSVTFDIKSNHVSCSVSGSGDLFLLGQCKSQHVRLTGSGTINSSNLIAKNCTLEASGSGNCNLNIVDVFILSISGSCRVAYSGDPTVQSKFISKSAKLIKI